MKARDLITQQESAIVIFTDGTHLHMNTDGTGTTGYWVINPERTVDKVIIYHRRQSSDVNDVYIGNYLDVIASPEEGRYNINLTGLHLVDSTKANWHEFAESGANPIRYFEKSN